MDTETFIHLQYIDDIAVCDELLQYYKESNDKVLGTCYSHKERTVDFSVKQSVDCPMFLDREVVQKYYKQLDKIVHSYAEKFTYCDEYAPWGLVEIANLQFYPPGGGFKQWHTERAGISSGARHLVFMTYLNDVTDGGETEFFYQKIKVQPKKGLTVI